MSNTKKHYKNNASNRKSDKSVKNNPNNKKKKDEINKNLGTAVSWALYLFEYKTSGM